MRVSCVNAPNARPPPPGAALRHRASSPPRLPRHLPQLSHAHRAQYQGTQHLQVVRPTVFKLTVRHKKALHTCTDTPCHSTPRQATSCHAMPRRATSRLAPPVLPRLPAPTLSDWHRGVPLALMALPQVSRRALLLLQVQVHGPPGTRGERRVLVVRTRGSAQVGANRDRR